MIRKGGLGRGLNALINSQAQLDAGGKELSPMQPQQGFLLLPIEKLSSGKYQPRQHMDQVALEELADSIKSQGVIQPIVVRPLPNQNYEIIAGERRWRAAQLAGLLEIPVVVKDIPDEAAIAVALIENIQREDLNPIEEARALQRLLEEFALTHQQIAEAVGKSRTAVTNLLRLLKLDKDVIQLLEKGDIEMGHARALLILDNQAQVKAAKQVVNKDLTVRETERLVRQLLGGDTTSKDKPPIDPNIRKLQDKLSEHLAAKISIAHKATGKGTLMIHYHSLDELQGILQKFGYEENSTS